MSTVILAVIAIALAIYTNWNRIKKISWGARIKIALIYVAGVMFATLCIYYGGNWFVGHFEKGIFREILTYGIIIVVLFFTIAGIQKLVSKVGDN
ncbi:hypothetical protein DX933_12295 [Ornithinibacillus gellani]|uniref:hypothetical protein n=1 Tax=Ornithinibacillus gellani TaxID=2293253 RepID=UPI000F4A2399|nr:hypothetical protein [Ornithinibacillus gellani]TQS74103.1 hypothetical protein DX933_12295 [Ornithinibacillus gellani]